MELKINVSPERLSPGSNSDVFNSTYPAFGYRSAVIRASGYQYLESKLYYHPVYREGQ